METTPQADGRSMRERMLAGDLYLADDPEIAEAAAVVQIGPNVQLLTPTHPVEPELRRDKWEAAEPVADTDDA
jgi:hypothetical protein